MTKLSWGGDEMTHKFPATNPDGISPRRGFGKSIWKYRWFYLLMLPGMLYFIVYRYAPMWGLLMAFQDYMPTLGIANSQWVGLKHFKAFFTYDRFYLLFRNTMFISVGSLVFSFPIPIILALLLNEVRNRTFKRATQTMLYLPHFLSSVVIVSIAYAMFSSQDGVVNNLLSSMGFERQNILMNEKTYRSLYIGLGIWQNSGWSTIIYLAALAGVDVQMYEASTIEGANRLQQVRFITLPSIMPILMVNLILSLGSIMDVGVEKTLLLSNAMNRSVAEVFDSYVYNRGVLGGEFSYSAAVGMFKSLVGLILVLGANGLSKKVTDEAIY